MNLHHSAATAPEVRGPMPGTLEAAPARLGNVNFHEVTIRLGARAQPRLILDRISLDIPSGQFVCVLGPSGCGKSTLLNALAGFVTPSGGRLAVDGDTISTPGADRGVVFQDPTLFPWKTVRGNVSYGLAVQGASRAEIKTQTVEYKGGDATLKGYLAYDDSIQTKRPGVLVVHEWWGLNDYVKSELKRCADQVRAQIHRNVFMNPSSEGAAR